MMGLCTAFLANLDTKEIKTVLDLILKHGSKNSNESSVFIVSQNLILLCPSPLATKFGRNIIESNPRLSTFNGQLQVKFNAHRKLVLIKQGRKTVLLEKPEEKVVVESKVRRQILSKQVELRRLESESLIKLLKNVESSDIKGSQSRTCIPENDTSNVNSVAQRTVKAEKCNHQILQAWIAPGQNGSYNNQAFPSQDKFPTQVSDVDTDGPNIPMVPSATYRFSSNGSSIPSAPYSSSQTDSANRLSGVVTSYSSNEAVRRSGSEVPSASHFSRGGINRAFGASSFASHSGLTRQSDSSFLMKSPPKYIQHVTFDSRLETFKSPSWLVNEKPDIHTFADQGLFFTGREDLVRCFMCGIGLKDWTKSDDVMLEHRKYSASCPYLLQKQQTTDVDASRQSGNQSSYRVRSPQYQTMAARLATFERFPSDARIPHFQLAVAGMFYTGQGDLCRCFTCDGGLKDWSAGDDPCKEHATYFPNCDYILQLKGADYVREMQRRRGPRAPQTGAAGSSAMHTSSTIATTLTETTTTSTTLNMPSMDRLHISGSLNSGSADMQLKEMGYSNNDVEHAKAELRRKGNNNPSVDLIVNTILDSQARTDTEQGAANGTTEAASEHEDLQDVVAEHERLSRIVQCMLCVNEEPDILFIPCAHHRICHNCSESITRCPVCDTVVKEKIRTYRS